MSTIKIDDLHPTGAELFSDSESYMNELGDGELEVIHGGSTIRCATAVSRATVKASKAVSRATKAGYKKARSAVHVYTPRIPRPEPTFSQYCTGWF